ncbi:MAG TPA: chemotaxis response regulator protein-glutamate methylesterase [Candidatus Binatia bacterium]|nr:chemotaxis response regulator protein-glutamate methylesterase [Candidatus Binatia bacterium]
MRIGIVNDTPFAVEALLRTIALKPEHEVVWAAVNGAEAVKACAKLTPDIILMDLIMPVMDGVEATRQIMSKTPCAILIVTSSVGANSAQVFEAMGHGALDAVNTPPLGVGDPLVSAAGFFQKLETVGKLIRDKAATPAPAPARPAAAGAEASKPQAAAAAALRAKRGRMVAIGASAGGPTALSILLRGLPKDFPAAVIVVQHVDEHFASGMADWLAGHCALPVRIAQENEAPRAGTVLLAGTADHLKLKAHDKLGYSAEPKDHAYRPSVDVFFQSVSEVWQGEAVGVLLTGMGKDGAVGLKALRNKGYHTIAQDRDSSAVYGMPKAAATMDAAVDIMPVNRIAAKLVQVLAAKN